jgi:hypothetical protein
MIPQFDDRGVKSYLSQGRRSPHPLAPACAAGFVLSNHPAGRAFPSRGPDRPG